MIADGSPSSAGPSFIAWSSSIRPWPAADPEGFPRYTAQLTESTTTAYQPDLLEGVVVLEHPGAWLPAEPGNLYQATLPSGEAVRPTTLRLIPYYAWSNRQLSAMQVWIPTGRG